jgi:hypothetical protein
MPVKILRCQASPCLAYACRAFCLLAIESLGATADAVLIFFPIFRAIFRAVDNRRDVEFQAGCQPSRLRYVYPVKRVTDQACAGAATPNHRAAAASDAASSAASGLGEADAQAT